MAEQEANLYKSPQVSQIESGRVVTVLSGETNLSPRQAMKLATKLKWLLAMELGIDPDKIHPYVREPHHPIPYKEIPSST